MTESDWTTSTDPQQMLSFLLDRGQVSERKLRLFGVTAASEVQRFMSDERSRDGLRVAEAVADGLARDDERARADEVAGAAHVAAEAAYEAVVNESTYAEDDEVIAAGWRLLVPVDAAGAARATLHPSAVTAAADVVRLALSTEEWDRQAARWEAGQGRNQDYAPGPTSGPRLAAFLRDIFGNPFLPIRFSPSRRTEPIVALARSIYEEQAFDRLPVLADALEKAGCAEPDVLEHCRGSNTHVRGCWVVDRVLGKT